MIEYHYEHLWYCCCFDDDDCYSYCVEGFLALVMGSGEGKMVHLVAVVAVVHDGCSQRQVYLVSVDVPMVPSRSLVSLPKEAIWIYMETSLSIVSQRYHHLLIV